MKQKAYEREYRRPRGARVDAADRVTARQVVRDEVRYSDRGLESAEPGMWVVTDPDGRTGYLSDVEFRARYEEVPPTVRESILRLSWLGWAVAAVLLFSALDVQALGGFSDFKAWGFSVPDWVIVALCLMTLALAIASFWGYRRDGYEKALKTLALVAIPTATLGLASYWPCGGPNAPVLNPITWTMLLFIGEFESAPFQEGGACPNQMPIALQLARLIAVTMIISVAVLAALKLWGQVFERFRVGLRGDMDVVVGLNSMSKDLIRLLVTKPQEDPEKCVPRPRPSTTNETARKTEIRRRYRRLVVIDSQISEAALEEVADLEFSVVEGDASDWDFLSSLLMKRGLARQQGVAHDDAASPRRRLPRPIQKRAVRHFYVLTETSSFNRTVAELALSALRRTQDDRPVTVMARLDDPREAETHRLKHAVAETTQDLSVLSEVICPIEVTASLIADVISRERITSLRFVGDGPLMIALANELVWRFGSRLALGEPLPPISIEWWGAGVGADSEWNRIRERLGVGHNDASSFVVRSTQDAHPKVEEIDRDLAGTRAYIYLGSASQEGRDLANRVAGLDPDAWVFAPSSEVVGLRRIDRHFLLYGGTVLPGHNLLPEGPWVKLARLTHDQYRMSKPQPAWEELSASKRQSNYDFIRHTMAFCTRDLPYVWRTGTSPDPILMPEPAEIEMIARAEHERWRKQEIENGWSYGPTRDDCACQNPNITDWEQLSEVARAGNFNLVRNLIERMVLLGLHLEPKTPGSQRQEDA